jgi:probable rRNA maturation factor
MQIVIENSQDKFQIYDNIAELIENVAIECMNVDNKSINYEVSVTFVDDEEIRILNNEYRNIDRSTDVLSFPMGEEDNFNVPYTPLLGDIVISLETAQRQAREFGHSLEREIAYLTAHSMFHLIGYDHINEADKIVMREKEKLVMKNLGIFKK